MSSPYASSDSSSLTPPPSTLATPSPEPRSPSPSPSPSIASSAPKVKARGKSTVANGIPKSKGLTAKSKSAKQHGKAGHEKITIKIKQPKKDSVDKTDRE